MAQHTNRHGQTSSRTAEGTGGGHWPWNRALSTALETAWSMSWSSLSELLLTISRGGHQGTDLPGCKNTYPPFSLAHSMTWTLDLSQCLGTGAWKLSHPSDSSRKVVNASQEEVSTAALAVLNYAVSGDGLIKWVWSISSLMHRAEVEEKVFFMYKESLFRAFWTSQCFSLPRLAFNGRRKVSYSQCCQPCDVIMSQCLLFCLKPHLLETMDYVRIFQLWLEKQRKLVVLLVSENWLKHDPGYILRNTKPYLELITFLCVCFEANCMIFLLGGAHLTHDFWMLGEWCYYNGDTTDIQSNSVEWFLT